MSHRNDVSHPDSHRETPNERTPLVKIDDSHSNRVCCGTDCESYGWVKKELIALLRLAFPMILTQILWMTSQVVTLMLVGHIHAESALLLDAAALALFFVNITGNFIVEGLATAADTLCSQSFGYKSYHKVGHVFQRGILILMAATLFIWCIWLNSESILLLLQQNPCVTRLAGTFVWYYILSLPAVFMNEMLEKYLNAQNIVWPFVIGGFFSNILSAGFNVALIFGAGLELNGAAIALVLTNYSRSLFIIVYMWTSKIYSPTWTGWSWESLQGWGQFLKLGIPGVFMICIDWISYEVGFFILGLINVVQLAIGAILLQLVNIYYMIGLGIATAATVRVGSELGAGHPVRAKRAAYLSIALGVFSGLSTMVFIEATQTVIGQAFTSNKEVLDGLPVLLHILSAMSILDQIQATCCGILKGVGRQLLGAIGNFVAFYIFGLPLGISLALFVHMGALGMWIGFATASLVQFLIFTPAVIFTNWEKESDKAISLAMDEAKQLFQAKASSLDCHNININTLHETLSSKESSPPQEVNCQCVSCEPVEDDDHHSKSTDTQDQEKASLQQTCLAGVCSHSRLLLSKGSVFVLGAVLMVAAGFASQYHPPGNIINGNHSQCTVFEDSTLSSSAIQQIYYKHV